MRRALVAVLVIVAACGRDEAQRWFVVEQRIELCAAAPHAVPLDQVQATQWRVELESGEHALPDEQRLHTGIVASVDGSPMPLLLDVRDVDGTRPFAAIEGAVVEGVDLSLRPDAAHDVFWVRAWLGSLLGESGSWLLSLGIETDAGEDFGSDAPRSLHFGCLDDVQRGACPNRFFDVCDPGGPTVRTRVTLDRGEVVLDVRWIEGDPTSGDLHREMFVASEVHLDDVAVVQSDFFRLLHVTGDSEIGDGAYAVLAPESLEPAGLGCGIAIADIGTEQPRAFTVDCTMQELEPLAIVDVARETLP